MSQTTVIGIDLSGPSNTKDTAVAVFRLVGNDLQFSRECAGTDADIVDLVMEEASDGKVIVGIDAPLSYQPGGGDRVRDTELRSKIVSAGLHSGSVMTPTMTRMVYLTLRGISIARMLSRSGVEIVEVHPGASMVLAGAAVDDVRQFSRSLPARRNLLDWLERRGLTDIKTQPQLTSHFVAACAAAFAANLWANGQFSWCAKAEQPFHPYDFAC